MNKVFLSAGLVIALTGCATAPPPPPVVYKDKPVAVTLPASAYVTDPTPVPPDPVAYKQEEDARIRERILKVYVNQLLLQIKHLGDRIDTLRVSAEKQKQTIERNGNEPVGK